MPIQYVLKNTPLMQLGKEYHLPAFARGHYLEGLVIFFKFKAVRDQRQQIDRTGAH